METKCTRDWASRNGLTVEASETLYSLCQAVNEGHMEPGFYAVAGCHVRIDEGGSFIAAPQLRCAECGEESGAAGSSMYGAVHKYGPTNHAFKAEAI